MNDRMKRPYPCPACTEPVGRCEIFEPGDGECSECGLYLKEWNHRPIEDALRAEVEELTTERNLLSDTCVDLRAEVARLKDDQKQGGIDYCNLRIVADERLVEIIALKGRLKRYTGPLTDEQVSLVWLNTAVKIDHCDVPSIDAAIRAAREGER